MKRRARWITVSTISLLSATVVGLALKAYWREIAYRHLSMTYGRQVLMADFEARNKPLPEFEYYEKRWKFLPGPEVLVPDQLCGTCAVAGRSSLAHRFECFHGQDFDPAYPRLPLGVVGGRRAFVLKCTCDHPAHANREE